MTLVAKYRLDIIEELARQMAFAPQGVRERQLTAAEDLAVTLEPDKAYPYEFIVFRITDYKPRKMATDLLTGLALQHDLGLLIESLSSTLRQRTCDREEPVLSIEDLTEKFNVTSKTIQRWRRRGLVARRFVFPDGKLRVGFRLTVVQQFLLRHQGEVATGANVADWQSGEIDYIIRNARRLVAHGCCTADELARRIARKINRSPLTVVSVLRKYDAENTADAILPHAAPPPGEGQCESVVRASRDGRSLRETATALGMSRSMIYPVLLRERLTRVMSRRMKFHDDPLYHDEPDEHLARLDQTFTSRSVAHGLNGSRPSLRSENSPSMSAAECALLAMVRSAEEQPAPAVKPVRFSSTADGEVPSYLRAICQTPLLSPAKERALFLLFNYRKFRFIQARRRLDPAKARVRDVCRLEALLDAVVHARNDLLSANLRLVVSVARKHTQPGVPLLELVSEGNTILMRAVNGFDVHRAFKFSSYATFALMKGFARAVPLMKKRLPPLPDGVPVQEVDGRADAFSIRDEARHLLGLLTPTEARVIGQRFDLPASLIQSVSFATADDSTTPPLLFDRRSGEVNLQESIVDENVGGRVRQLTEEPGPPVFSDRHRRRLEKSALAKIKGLVNVSDTNAL